MDQAPAQQISLSLTASYAPSWGLWEGVREIVQNWHDGLLSGSEAQPPQDLHKMQAVPLEFTMTGESRHEAARCGVDAGWCEYVGAQSQLVLVNRNVGLGRQVLLMGYSRKADHQDVIGSFGEGLKVGAVALLRRGLGLRMLTREEAWTFHLAVDPAFGERVLAVGVSPRPPAEDFELQGLPAVLSKLGPGDTATVLGGVRPEEWADLSRRFLFLWRPREAVRTEVGSLLLDPEYRGSLYVRGVFISNEPDLASGVDLHNIRLDRDRAAVLRKSDLEHQVSSMWARALHYRPELLPQYYELLSSEKSSDTALAELYCEEDLCERLAAEFRQRHGGAVPVSLKDANTAKADRVRTALASTTVVCSQALLAVLRKGGVRCDLGELLREGESQARRFLAVSALGEAEALCLAQACALAELGDPAAAPLLARLDPFESSAAWAAEGMAAAAEAFPAGGRVEIDRRALDLSAVHTLLGGCLHGGGGGDGTSGLHGCWCRQAALACAIHAARSAADPKAVPGHFRERVLGKLAREARADEKADRQGVVRCPELGEEREAALRVQIEALLKELSEERSFHATQLKALQRRVAEAEQELARSEFRFMDAADAERAVREEWGPELAKLRQESAQGAALREQLAQALDQAATSGREAALHRSRCGDLEGQVRAAQEARRRQAEAMDLRAQGLRQLLARRWRLLQPLLGACGEAPGGGEAGAGGGGGKAAPPPELLRRVVEDVRAAIASDLALQSEAGSSLCCVCADAVADMVLLPCRHQQLCLTCAANLDTCPLCRVQIRERMQVFR